MFELQCLRLRGPYQNQWGVVDRLDDVQGSYSSRLIANNCNQKHTSLYRAWRNIQQK